MRPSPRWVIVALLTLVVLQPELCAAERYFIILFGAQSEPPRAKYAHTWSAYVKATGEGDDVDSYHLHVRTDSWLPPDARVQVWRLRPQEGRNFDLYTTFDIVLADRDTIAEWGPYETDFEAYRRGTNEIDRLEAGIIKYRAIDGPSRRSNIKNCFHSISDVLDRQDSRRRYPLRQTGFRVTDDIVEFLLQSGRIINPGQDNGWLDRRLRLDCYPITHKTRRL
jgi:hypothetical protein